MAGTAGANRIGANDQGRGTWNKTRQRRQRLGLDHRLRIDHPKAQVELVELCHLRRARVFDGRFLA